MAVPVADRACGTMALVPSPDAPPPGAGALVLAATPIGNVRDASPRLVELLATADVVAAEDTRRLARLAAALGVTVGGRVVSFYEDVEASRIPGLVAAVRGGATVLVVTERTARLETGVLRRRRREVPLSRVVDVGVERSLGQRLVGSGTLVLATAGALPALVLRDAPRANALADAVADRVDAGYVMVNEYFAGGPAVPFGGTKLSGTGRERGLVALESYLTRKSVVVRTAPGGTPPRLEL